MVALQGNPEPTKKGRKGTMELPSVESSSVRRLKRLINRKPTKATQRKAVSPCP